VTARDHRGGIDGLGWLWPVAAPVAPVLFAVAALQFLGAPDLPKDEIAKVMGQSGATALRHSGDRLAYVASVCVHTGVCLATAFYFVIMLHRLAIDGRRQAVAALTAIAGTTLVLMIVLSWIDPPLTVYALSYFNIDAVLRASALAADLTGEGPPGALSPLAVAVLFPSALGIIDVALAAGVVCLLLRRIGPPHADGWEMRFQTNIRPLFRSFYGLGAVLVTSTATELFFFRLPVGLVNPQASGDVGAALGTYASAVATFWGAVYTLTLFAVFACPLAILYARARRHVEADGDTEPDLGTWLAEHGFDSTLAQNLKNLLVMLAPLLIGPLGELARAASG
jgi:hypothetical protein